MSTYYVSTTGNDESDGTELNPFKTIQYAASLAKPGTTILVKPGIYRERISPVTSGTSSLPIVFKSIVKNSAIIRGSSLWKYTTNDSSKQILSGMIDSSIFTDNSHVDGGNPFLVKSCVTPYKREGAPELKEVKNSDPNMVYCLGQVFVDDVMYTQCPYYSEMENLDKSWFYDSSNNNLYIHGATTEQTIEITNQRRLFAPHKRGLRYITIDGFIFEHCGNQYPNQFWSVRENQQAGAVGTRSGRNWKIINNIIRFATGVGIDWGNEGGFSQDLEIGDNGNASGSDGHIISNNIISDNGAAGTAAYMAKRFIFSNNIVERNNNLHFYGKRRWESAGLKIHRPYESTIVANIIRNNYCHGIWCDQGASQNSIFKNNIILDNEGDGINFEIGQNTSGKVVNNIFDGNECGVTFVTSGGVLVAHNLFIKSHICDIKTVIFNRTADKWDSLNVEVFYNMFFHSPQFIQMTPTCYTSGMMATRYLNYNLYMTDDNNDLKFQIVNDSKTKVSYGFNSWSKAICDSRNPLNDDELNGDEESCIIRKNNDASIYYDETIEKYILLFDFVDKIPKYPNTDKIGYVSDYFGNIWDTTSFPGAFNHLCQGKNKIVL
jgi:hypothetical protein